MNAPGLSSAGGRPHVVHVLSSLNAGGVESLLLGLKSTPPFSEFRHSVVCVNGVQGLMVDRFHGASIEAWSCPILWPESLPIPSYRVSRWIRTRLAFTFRRRLISRVRALGADLVHSHVTVRIDEQASAVLAGARRPWVWTIHGMYQPEGEEMERWKRAGRMIDRGRARVTAVSAASAADIRARGFWTGRGVEVTYPGVDLREYGTRRAPDGEWRTRWNIPSDAVVYGTTGRLVPQKAYDVLLAAAGVLAAKGLSFHVVIAGEGSQRESLEKEIRRRGLQSCVTLLGHESDVPGFLANLDVFVMPSRSEGFGIALLEALASGLPCVGTRVGGIPELVGGQTGLLVPPEDPEELANAMARLSSPGFRATVAAGSQEVAGRFSLERCAQRFTAIYRELLDEERRN
jgi:glycosyltransferase involved in cell wall biosynthesis